MKRYTQLREQIAELLMHAAKKGIDQVSISMVLAKGLSVSARMGEVETLQHHDNVQCAITVYDEGRRGEAEISDYSPLAMASTLDKACALAKLTSHDDCAGLPATELLAYEYPDVDLYHPWTLKPKEAIQMTLNCDRFARQLDPRVQLTESVFLHVSNQVVIQANSQGFFGSVQSTEHSFSCAVIGEHLHEKHRDFDYTVAHDPKKLLSPEEVAKKAVGKAIRRLGARKLTTRVCPVLFEPPVARSLIRSFIGAISGSNLYRNLSFLKNHLGKQIFPAWVSISQSPHVINTIGSSPFDAEGVLTKPLDYIEKGTLVNYVLNSYSAKKLGLRSTGNAGGVYNLSMQADQAHQKDFSTLLKEMDTGIVITELMGQGVNLAVGDYSRGAFGFWVEKGEIQYPVEEITIAGNLKTMFEDICALGNDHDERSNIKAPSILIEKMTVAGT